MPNLPISQLPLSVSGSPNSLMVIVNYDTVATGRTESLYFSAITQQFKLLSTTGITVSSQTLTTSYNYYGVNYNGNVDLTLPSPVGNNGVNLIIKDEGGYSGIYRIRLTPPTGTIDGSSYVDMNTDYMSLTLMARNNNWWII